MQQATAPAKEAENVRRAVEGLEHLRAEIIVDGSAGHYTLTKIPDARQRNALLLSYRAEKDGGAGDFAKLVIKAPSPEAVRTDEAQEEVKRLLVQHKKTMGELSHVSSVPKLHDGYLRVCGVELSAEHCLIRQFIEGQTLDEWMKDPVRCHGGEFRGLDDIREWFQLARRLVRALAEIHRLRIFHGDLRPENIVYQVDGPEPKIIYVNAEDEAGNRKVLRNIEKAGSFRQKYDAPVKLFTKATPDAEAVLQRGGIEWFAPADIFSLGATLFELACGRETNLEPFHLEEHVYDGWYKVGAYQRRKRDEVVKTHVLDALITRYGEQLRRKEIATGVLAMCEVIMGCVRLDSRNQVADIEGILQILDQFDPPPESIEKKREAEWQPRYRAFDERTPKAFRAVADRRIDLAAQEMKEGNRRGPLRVLGDRQTFLDVMITALGSLVEGEESRALLTPTFFSRKNMGLFGRLTTALQLAQLRGVCLRWLIAVDEHRMRDREVAAVLEYQKMAGELITKLGGGEYGVRYVPMWRDDFEQLAHDKMMFIDAGPRSEDEEEPGPRVLIAPEYWEGHLITVLRLWPEPQGFSKYVYERDAFLKYEEMSIPIRSFQR